MKYFVRLDTVYTDGEDEGIFFIDRNGLNFINTKNKKIVEHLIDKGYYMQVRDTVKFDMDLDNKFVGISRSKDEEKFNEAFKNFHEKNIHNVMYKLIGISDDRKKLVFLFSEIPYIIEDGEPMTTIFFVEGDRIVMANNRDAASFFTYMAHNNQGTINEGILLAIGMDEETKIKGGKLMIRGKETGIEFSTYIIKKDIAKVSAGYLNDLIPLPITIALINSMNEIIYIRSKDRLMHPAIKKSYEKLVEVVLPKLGEML